MQTITCPSCRHENFVGARQCEVCGKSLSTAAIRRAMGKSILQWVRATAIGQVAPFALLILLLVAAMALSPSAAAWRHLWLTFGLVGLVTLGVIFPLLKGQYDFAAGPLAGLAACCAVVLSPYGYIPALAGALGIGALIGFVNGFLSGWTRVSSAMITIITGAIALQITVAFTGRADLLVRDPFLTSLGETNVLGVPVILTLFILALAGARVLLNQTTFLSVGSAPNDQVAMERAAPQRIVSSFVVSGVMAGIAGLLIASCGLADMGLAGQVLWVLTPLAAALIGGASVAGGTGGLRTAAVGAAVISVSNWLCVQLRMPISGPIMETPYLVLGLLGDRWKNMTYYMIVQARQGNLFALPEDLRLPMVNFFRGPTLARQITSLVVLLAVGVGVWLYVGFYVAKRVPDGSAVLTRVLGAVEVQRRGQNHTTLAQSGTPLHPGDVIYTGNGSQASLRMHDGSEVRVYPDSEMAIDELSIDDTGAHRTRLSMRAGAFFAKVRKMFAAHGTFDVQTPILTLGVRGTAFEVRLAEIGGQVSVGEGEVEVQQVLEVKTGKKEEEVAFVQDIRTIDAGKALQAQQAGLSSRVRHLAESEFYGLLYAAQEADSDAKKDAFSVLQSKWFTVLGVLLMVSYIWFVFIYCQPAAASYLPDIIAKRGEQLLNAPTPTKADLPTAVALAQMCLKTGESRKALEALNIIIRLDRDGEYGKWASRLFVEIDRDRKK